MPAGLDMTSPAWKAIKDSLSERNAQLAALKAITAAEQAEPGRLDNVTAQEVRAGFR